MLIYKYTVKVYLTVDGKENIKPNSPELKLPSINGLSGDNSPMKSVRMSLNASTPRKSQQGEISRAVSPDAGGDNEEEDDVPEIESTLPAVIITQNKVGGQDYGISRHQAIQVE